MSAIGAACLAAGGAASCNGVRPAKSPWDDIELTTAREAAPLPDDCDARFVDGECHIEADPTGKADFRVACDLEPPRSALVGEARVCLWPGVREVRPIACRAGGDTIIELMPVSEASEPRSLRGDLSRRPRR